MQRIMDSGSNYRFYEHEFKENVKRSAFELSHIHASSFRIGALYPVYVQWTLPNSEYRISVSDVFRSLPMTVPLMSRLRVFFHFYYCSWTQLWNKAQSFVDKSASGTKTIRMPYIDECNTHEESLWRYFGLPQFQTTTISGGQIVVPSPHDVSALKVSALPFMMYQKIYRDYYLNRNYQFNDQGEFDVGWYPDEEEDFRIMGSGTALHQITPVEDLDPIDLTVLRYRDYTPDYFTSALPRPQLGEPVGISLVGAAAIKSNIFGDPAALVAVGSMIDQNPGKKPTFLAFDLPNDFHPEHFYRSIGVGDHGFGPDQTYKNFDNNSLPNVHSFNNSSTAFEDLKYDTVKRVYADLSNISAVTIDQLRLLNMNQIEMEKLARCDGTYGSFMRSFYGLTPSSSQDMRPKYLGGTYQPIIVSDVVQTSSTVNTESQTSVQGNQTGKGFASDENANIGTCFSDDFGLIMGIMSIMPDTYYGQGIDRQWTIETQDDLYFPDRAGLSMQEIKLKEIFASRTSSTQNETIFAYQNRYDEWRYRQNYCTGYLGDSSKTEYFSYIQQRNFNSAPTYSQSWVTTEDNISYEQWFAKELEPPFIGQMYFDVRGVQPLPYRGIPQGLFGLSA